MDKILITGGAGFIGSYLVKETLKAFPGAQVANVDKLTYAADLARLEDLEGIPSYHFYQADIADENKVKTILRDFQPSIIINAAAESHVDNSIASVAPFIHTNINGVATLLACALGSGVSYFLQVSTDEVYGPNTCGVPFIESDPRNPKNPYAATKAAGEMLIESFANTHGLRTCITRGCNTYGLGQHPEKLIPKMITRAKKGQDLPLYGDGRQTREWLHVHDHVQGIIHLVKNKAQGIFNIGSNHITTNVEVVKTIQSHVKNADAHIVYTSDRPGHDRAYGLNSQKLKDQGWAPGKAFEHELKKIINET